MRIRALYSLFFLIFGFFSSTEVRSEPTTQASNVAITAVECSQFRIDWTKGNGIGRLVVVKEGSAVDATPTDNTDYSQSSIFGSGDEIGVGTGNYVVYNTIGSFITITGLKQGTTYHVAIFEYDDPGGGKDYLTTSPARANATTKDMIIDFSFTYSDSCTNNNEFFFKNESTTNVTGLTYTWNFGDGNSTTSTDPSHSFDDPPNYEFNVSLTATPSYGCTPNKKVKKVAIVPFPNLLPTVTDTIQCIAGNDYDFLGDATFNFPPSQYAFNYFWDFKDGTTSTARKYNKTFKQPGKYNVALRITMIKNTVVTNCKDTGYIEVTVLPEPSSSMIVSDTILCLNGNNITFSNDDPDITSWKWDFGDGFQSNLKTVNHSYNDTGTYEVVHEAIALTGCEGKDTQLIKILPDRTAQFTSLDADYCKNVDPVNLIPEDPSGQFFGLGIAGSTFIPNNIGTYDIQYIVADTVCPDTVTKTVTVRDIPDVQLPNDTLLCDETSYTLVSSAVGNHKWSTGETSNIITVYDSDEYKLVVDDGFCKGRDSVTIFFETTPNVDLGMDTTVCKTSIFVLRATHSNSTYEWNNGGDDSILAVTKDGLYEVKVTNMCGTSTDQIYINFEDEHCNLFVPNAFTPNGDARNQLFYPQGDKINIESFEIFNQWGEKVFAATDEVPAWDGTLGGSEPLPNSTYLWIVVYTVTEGEITVRGVAKGDVVLLR